MPEVLRKYYRNNHQRCSVRRGVLRSFTKFTRTHLCQSLFFNKVAGLPVPESLCLRSAILIKKRLWLRCFSVNFAKFLRTFFYRNLRWLLLMLRKRCCICLKKFEQWYRKYSEWQNMLYKIEMKKYLDICISTYMLRICINFSGNL